MNRKPVAQRARFFATRVGALIPLGLVGGLLAATTGCESENEPLPEAPYLPSAGRPLPSIIGGTLLVTNDGTRAVVADPDRDRISVVDLAARKVISEIELSLGAEPGRLVEDGAGMVHVALRQKGELVTVNPSNGDVVREKAVCAAPRGMMYDASADTILVACATGELVTLDPASLAQVRSIQLDRDIRDVAAIEGGELLISRFRTPELVRVDANGQVVSRRAPMDANFGTSPTGAAMNFTPTAAWRSVPIKAGTFDGGVAMVHQRALEMEIPATGSPTLGYYQGMPPDNTVVHGTVSIFLPKPDDTAVEGPPPAVSLPLISAALPVDIAVSNDGSAIIVAAAGVDRIYQFAIGSLQSDPSCVASFCGGSGVSSPTGQPVDGQPVAVAFQGSNNQYIVQTREPAALVFSDGKRVELGGQSVLDQGHEMFHRPPGTTSAIACASCHLEGGDDGHTWTVQGIGPRRTQTLRGGISQTTPFHWAGEIEDMTHIMVEVGQRRMGGSPNGPRAILALEEWMDGVQALPRRKNVEASAVERGATLFNDPQVACVSCHSGGMLTNNETRDVGTGAAMQVPTLVNIADRAPFMHDGCAKTLRDRFEDPACGGGDKHGVTSHLSASQLDDLVAYLETL